MSDLPIHEPTGRAPAVGATALPLPPLRIHHLMIWMTVTALLVSGSVWFDRTARGAPPIANKLVVAGLIGIAISVAGALFCAGWGFKWRARGCAFPAEPGQWLVAGIAAVAVGFFLWVAGTFAVFFIEEDWMEAFQWVFIAAAGFGLMAKSLVVARRHCHTTAWRALFYYLAALPPICVLLQRVRPPLIVYCIGIAAAILLWAVWRDVERKQIRHWTHWFGVGASGLLLICFGALMSA